MKNEKFKCIQKEILDRLVDERIAKIILFGSVARGEANEESDIDLLVMTRSLPLSEIRNFKIGLQKKLIELQMKYKIGIDLIVDDTDRFYDRIEKIKDQFYDDILSEGKVLYAQ